MRKKYETHCFPMTMVGGFFEEDYILDFKEYVLKDTAKKDLTLFLTRHIESFDFSTFPDYVKAITVVHNENFNTNPGELPNVRGFAIGVSINNISEQYSVKRARIDIRNALILTGLVDPEAHTDSIVLFSETLKVKVETV